MILGVSMNSSASRGAGERVARHVGGGEAAHRGVEVPEGLLGDDGRHLGADAEADVVLVDDEAAAGLGDRRQHGVAVERADRAQVDDLDRGAVLVGDDLGRLEAQVAVQAVGDDGEVVAWPGDLGQPDRHPPARRRRAPSP